MRGMTLSQWLDLLIEEYGMGDLLDILRLKCSDRPELRSLALKLEEAVVLALQNEVKR